MFVFTTAMSFFSFSRAISHFCSVFRGHLWIRMWAWLQEGEGLKVSGGHQRIRSWRTG